MRYYLTPVRMSIIQKRTNNKCWQGRGAREPLCTVGSNVNGAATVENRVEIPQKIKNTAIIQSSNSTTGYIFKKTQNN